jgi:hypothetical protein
MAKTLLNWCSQSINRSDVVLAVLFIAIFTFQPHYADGPLNLFELGLYLPSIDGILHGLVPYKDFFYLRGPLEIYPPALMMKIFGENVSYLSLYFYIGNVLCLVMSCLIGAELLRTRFIFYAFIPSLVSRAFPRAVFSFWGGFRYVWGMLFVYLMIRAVKTQRGRLFFFAGLAAACAALTSIEIGVCCFLSSAALFLLMRSVKSRGSYGQDFRWELYVLGAISVLIPFLLYFWQVKALTPFIEDVQAVVFKSHPTFMTQLTSSSPKTFFQFLQAMVPGALNFKYMTPLYCFLTVAGVLAWEYRGKSFGNLEFSLVILLVYAFVLYLAAFRIIEGGQFETVLQVEKIAYFFIIETAFLWLLSRQRVVAVIYLTAVLIVSWCYSLDRYDKRFPLFTLIRSQFDGKFYAGQMAAEGELETLTFERARGVRTSSDQARELESVVGVVGRYTVARDKIFVYPDMGSYYFFSKRDFAGRFPIGTLSWMREDWHQELMRSLNAQMPKLIILNLKLDENFTKVYFKRASNEEYFKDVVHFINAHYDLVATTPLSGIYLRKN